MEDEIEIQLKKLEIEISLLNENVGRPDPDIDEINNINHQVKGIINQIRYYLKLKK